MIDTSELRDLVRDLGRLSARAEKQVEATTTRAALNIKNDLIREAKESGTTYFDRVRLSISYDVDTTTDGVTAEIGPVIGGRGGQGSLAFLAYEGDATRAPSFPDPSGALEREAEAFERFLGEAATEGL